MLQTGLTLAAAFLIGSAMLAYAFARGSRFMRSDGVAPRRTLVSEPITQAASDTPLSSEEHWRRASGIVSSASEQMTAMHRHQKAAAGHLDSADYALQQLKDELAHIMPVAQRAPSGTLHQLKPAAPRQAPRTGKAAAA